MDFEVKLPELIQTQEELRAEVLRVDQVLGKLVISRPDFDRLAKVTSGTLIRRFGTWKSILEGAGLGEKYGGPIVTEKLRTNGARYLTDEEVLTEIRAIAQKLGLPSITRNDIRQHSDSISDGVVRKRFGSWEAGMKLAGLGVSPQFRKKLSDDEYFENLLEVWTHLGKQPAIRQMDETPSLISAGAYESHFGTWSNTLKLFAARLGVVSNKAKTIDPDLQTETKKVEAKTGARESSAVDRRTIPLGLRYKVLSRDNFKCSRCGNSPATDPTCKLHVDHIVPFSVGGRTILENLQILCSDCNLGKGNRHTQ